MIDYKYIEYVISKFKDCEIIDILGDNTEENIEINLRDKFNKGYEFQNECKLICDEIYDYLLDNGFNGFCISGTKKDEKEYGIKFIKME